MKCTNHSVLKWVEEMAAMTKPDQIVWIDGSTDEKDRLQQEAVSTGELTLLDQTALPGCTYHRTALNDVARVEHRTFICTSKKEDAGHTNNWMAPAEMYAKLRGPFYRLNDWPDDVCYSLHHGSCRITAVQNRC